MAVTTVAPAFGGEGFSPRRLSVEEFERIPEGVFPEGERLELIDGLIYTKVGQNDPHIFALLYAFRTLQGAFGSDYLLTMQTPARFGEYGKVEPDLLVLRGQIEDYEGRLVDPATDVALLVEISDASLPYDMGLKARLYATHGVPEYWIVNLRSRTLQVYRKPEGQAYRETTVFPENDHVLVNGREIAVLDLLPKKG